MREIRLTVIKYGEQMFNTDDKIKRAFLFYAPRERIQNVNPIRRTSKDEVCT